MEQQPRPSDYFDRRRRALTSKASAESRIALVATELGLSAAEIDAFYYVNRAGAKRRFDFQKFAIEYGISRDWLFDGLLPQHPRGLQRKSRRKNPEARMMRREALESIRLRILEIAAALNLSPADIKPLLTTKRLFPVMEFAKKYSINAGWLVTGEGRVGRDG